MRILPSLLALGLAAGLSGPAFADEITVWRAFVADHAEPVVSVLDLETGALIARFQTQGTASLYAAGSGETVFAVQGAANIVEAFATGISIDDHGDHGDIDVSDPAKLPGSVAGERPVHFVEHHGRIALFFDGDGVVRIVNEADFDGSVAVREIDSGAPHHGVAAAFGAHALVSVPHPEDPSRLPIGMQAIDPAGAALGDPHLCPDIHGEAHSGALLAIACADGLLLAKSGAQGPVVTHLPYGADLPEGKATTLLGGTGIQYFLGNFGADRVVLIDPAEETFRLVELPTRRVHFATDPARPQFAYIFTEDGTLHRLNVLSGVITDSLGVTQPYSMDGHWSDPRPRIAVAGDAILVTDPLNATIHRINARDFALDAPIAIDGLPFGIVAVGGSGSVH